MNAVVCLGLVMGKSSDISPFKLSKINALLQETGHT